jgi:hypothetical protein
MPPKVIIAIITEGRSDMALQACVSILHLQMQLMTTQDGFQADMRFFKTNNEAITELYKSKEFEGIFMLNFASGVPGEFALKALRSDKDVVFGIHPLATIDWDRVKEKIASTTETLQNTGVVYNLKLASIPDAAGFAKVADVQHADVMYVKRAAIDDIVERHPSAVSNDKKHTTILQEGIYDGVFMTAEQRFAHLYGKPIYADTALQCSKAGPADYVGIVGNRSQIR